MRTPITHKKRCLIKYAVQSQKAVTAHCLLALQNRGWAACQSRKWFLRRPLGATRNHTWLMRLLSSTNTYKSLTSCHSGSYLIKTTQMQCWIILYKPWRSNVFFIWNNHKCLSQLFPLHLNTYVMGLRPLEIFLIYYFFRSGDRLYTSESDVWKCQILKYKNSPRAERVSIVSFIQLHLINTTQIIDFVSLISNLRN